MKRLLQWLLVLCTAMCSLSAMAQTEEELEKFYKYVEEDGGYRVAISSAFDEFLKSGEEEYVYASGKTWKLGSPLPNPAPNGMYASKKVVAMNSMFSLCPAKTLDVSEFNTSNVKNMSAMFILCQNLETIIGLEKWNTDNVTDMSVMFAYCIRLKSFDLSHFQTQNVTNMHGMFGDCLSLEHLDLSSFKTDKVKDFGEFICFGLASETIKKDPSSYEGIPWQGSLRSIDISHFKIAADANIKDMITFRSPEIVYLPDFSGWKGDDSESAFAFSPSTIVCAAPGQTDIAEQLIDKSEDGEKNCGTITTFSPMENGRAYTECDINLFYNYEEVDGGLKVSLSEFLRMALDEGVGILANDGKIDWTAGTDLPNPCYGGMHEGKKVVRMDNMFAYCKFSDASIIKQFDTRNVKDMSRMFRSCENLDNVEILSMLNTDNVEDMSYMFTNCPLKNIPSMRTGNVRHMSGMFADCKNLTSVSGTPFDMSKVESINEMFLDCSSLTTVDVNWDTPALRDLIGAFMGCTSLREAKLRLNTSAVEDMRKVFYSCTSLETVDLSTWETGSATKMAEMFYECHNLKTLDISHFDMSSVKRALRMVYSSGLESLYLPEWASPIVGKASNAEPDGAANYYFHAPNATVYVHRGESETYKPLSYISDIPGYKQIVEVNYGPQLDATILDQLYDYQYAANEYGEAGYGVSLSDSFREAIDNGTSITVKAMDMAGTYEQESGESYTWNPGDPLPNPIEDKGKHHYTEVIFMNGMFENTKATSLDLSYFDTRTVKDMSKMFYNASELKSVKFSNLFYTGNVVNMGDMFGNAEKLESVDVSVFDTHNVRNMSGMFRSTNSMTALDLSNFDWYSLYDSQWLVSGESYQKLIMPQRDTVFIYGQGVIFDVPNADVYVRAASYEDVSTILQRNPDIRHKSVNPYGRLFSENDETETRELDREAQNILTNRTLTGNQWTTICLPFDLTAEQIADVFGKDTKVASYYSYEGNDLLFNSAETIEAGYPYLIKPANTVIYPYFQNAMTTESNVGMIDGAEDKDRDDMTIDFIGRIPKTSLWDTNYLLGDNGKLYLSATPGSQATLSIHLKNSTPTQGVQITMTLPVGITIAEEDGDYCIDKGARAQKGQDPEANFVDGVYIIGVLSTGGREYTGSEGEIITCVLDIAATVTPGDYEVKLTGVETNGISGVISKKGTHDYTGKITITAATGINGVGAESAPTDIYSANGMKQKSLQKGLNIVKRNGRVVKVMK